MAQFSVKIMRLTGSLLGENQHLRNLKQRDDKRPMMSDRIHPVKAAYGSGLTAVFHGDHLDEVLDTEWGECQDLDIFCAVDPDHAVFGLHADGEIMEAINAFAQFCRDAIDCLDGMDLVQLHGQAA